MKTLTYLILILFSPVVFAGKDVKGVLYDAVITRIIDGDTVAFEATFLPKPLKPELSIRVYGVDTPEKGHRSKCPSEASRGQKATEFTTGAVSSAKTIQILLIDWDKYGGRVLGDVILDGKSLREMLIVQGFAREYYGEAKKSWCE